MFGQQLDHRLFQRAQVQVQVGPASLELQDRVGDQLSRAVPGDVSPALDPDDAMARIAARGDDREVYEKRALLEHIASHYAEGFRRLAVRGDRIVEIDATLSMDAVEARVWRAVKALP